MVVIAPAARPSGSLATLPPVMPAAPVPHGDDSRANRESLDHFARRANVLDLPPPKPRGFHATAADILAARELIEKPDADLPPLTWTVKQNIEAARRPATWEVSFRLPSVSPARDGRTSRR